MFLGLKRVLWEVNTKITTSKPSCAIFLYPKVFCFLVIQKWNGYRFLCGITFVGQKRALREANTKINHLTHVASVRVASPGHEFVSRSAWGGRCCCGCLGSCPAQTCPWAGGASRRKRTGRERRHWRGEQQRERAAPYGRAAPANAGGRMAQRERQRGVVLIFQRSVIVYQVPRDGGQYFNESFLSK
jgi:hypothetical protein